MCDFVVLTLPHTNVSILDLRAPFSPFQNTDFNNNNKNPSEGAPSVIFAVLSPLL